jgi:hypothetical protein
VLRDWRKPGQFEEGSMIITESFDRKTLVAMEIALDRACESLGFAKEQHEAQSHIATKILECALHGDRSLGGLTEAGRTAALEMLAMDGGEPFLTGTV